MPDESTETAADRRVLHLRIPVELHTAISAYARASERSLNGAAIVLLRRGLTAVVVDEEVG